MAAISSTALFYLLLQWAKRLRNAKLLTVFLYILFPLLMSFAVSLPRVALYTTTLKFGVGPSQPIPIEVPVPALADGLPVWDNRRQLVWADESGGTGPVDHSALMASLPGRTDANTRRFNSQAELQEHCTYTGAARPACYAGLVFRAPSPLPTAPPLNFTLMYPTDALGPHIDVTTTGPLGTAGLLTLQMNVERAAVRQLLPGLASDVSLSSTLALPFTHVTLIEVNEGPLAYFYNFMANTGSAGMALLFAPHVFWLANTAATDVETRTRDAMLIMGLPRWTYVLSLALQYLALSLPAWLLVAAVMTFVTFTTTDFISCLLMLALTSLALLPAALTTASAFSKARLAGVVTAFGWFVVGAGCSQLEHVGVIGSGAVYAIVAILLPPAGLSIGVSMLSRAGQADLPIRPSTWATVIHSHGFSFGGLLACIAASAVLHALVYALLPAVHTPIFPTAACKVLRACEVEPEVTAGTQTAGAAGVEEVPLVLQEAREDAGSTTVVSLRGVWKTYPQAPKPSVRALSLDCCLSEVLVLLGKNGCGKTTTVQMIAGLLEPSYGSVTLAQGVSARVAGTIGWCPQHDILWSDVSVRDTLALYAAVKGMKPSDIAAEADKWAENAGLLAKLDAPAGTLSGGQKRRLSLAVALIGGSRILLLDEPTAGVDPVNRRLLWDIVNAHKDGRTVLLTTHFLDEAEALGDRIAVMDAGALRACGTSLFLKRSLGFGYTLTVSMAAGCCNNGALMTCVKEHVKEARLVSVEGLEVTVGLPLECNPVLPTLLRELEQRAVELDIDSVGISSASLHDVFMRLIGTGEAQKEMPPSLVNGDVEGKDAVSLSVTVDIPSKAVEEGEERVPLEPHGSARAVLRRVWAVLGKRAVLARADWRASLLPFLLMAAAAVAVAVGFKEQTPAECPANMDVVLPAHPVTLAYASAPYGPQRVLLLTNESASPLLDPTLITKTASMSTLRQAIAESPTTAWAGLDIPAPFLPATWPATATVAYDITLPFSDVRSIDTLYNALYARASGTGAALSAMEIQPFPTRTSAFSSRDWRPYLAFLGILLVVCAATIPLASTMLVAREKAAGLKLQQRMSGLRPLEYWAGNLVWDGVLVLGLAILAAAGHTGMHSWLPGFGPTLLLFFLYGVASTAWGYALSFATSTQAGAVALHASLGFVLGIGFVAGLITASPDPYSESNVSTAIAVAAMVAHPLSALTIGGLVPGANIVYQLCRDAGADYLVAHPRGGDWLAQPTFRLTLALLAGHALVLMSTVLLLEYSTAIRMRMRGCCPMACPLHSLCCIRGRAAAALPHAATVDPHEDKDVAGEKGRIVAAYGSGQALAGSGPNTDDIVVQDVKKRFWVRQAPVVAVHGVTIGLSSKQCFGLLGPNGAGKSTLLRMLSGQEMPDSGRLVVHGHELSTDLAGVQQSVGVCPQFDVLYGELNAVEHLRLYAAIKGVPPGPETEREVSSLIARLDLTSHAHKPSASLSGGNKRKLSVAIALVGRPAAIILDEPSTGMDPASKRFMWTVINDLRRTHTVILTTHSMEECEAVAQRVGVMVGGRLAALGTLPRLKARFGQRYQVDAVCSTSPEASIAASVLAAALPGSTVLEQHGQQIRLSVPLQNAQGKATSLADVLETLEANRESLALRVYQASHASLEQIFLDLAANGAAMSAVSGPGHDVSLRSRA